LHSLEDCFYSSSAIDFSLTQTSASSSLLRWWHGRRPSHDDADIARDLLAAKAAAIVAGKGSRLPIVMGKNRPDADRPTQPWADLSMPPRNARPQRERHDRMGPPESMVMSDDIFSLQRRGVGAGMGIGDQYCIEPNIAV
jgi:hypothetical protein